MKYRKKPVVIDAVQWLGTQESFAEIENMGDISWYGSRAKGKQCFYIDTLEGRMRVNKGDYVIKGVEGEFYPCRSDIFEATYTPINRDGGE